MRPWLRHGAGVATVVAGVLGSLYTIGIVAAGAEPVEPLGELLLTAPLSLAALALLALTAAAGGVAWLRGSAAAAALCAGAWAVLAALAARPDVQFGYVSPTLPQIEVPALGHNAFVVGLFSGSILLTLLARASALDLRPAAARLHSTAAEFLGGLYFLVCGLALAVRFHVDAAAAGRAAHELALAPLLAACLVCQAIGLALLLGFTAARAAAVVILLTLAASAVVPDLLFERVHVPLPVFWAGAAAVAAVGLLVPRRVRA